MLTIDGLKKFLDDLDSSIEGDAPVRILYAGEDPIYIEDIEADETGVFLYGA